MTAVTRIYECQVCLHKRVVAQTARPKCPMCRSPAYARKMNVVGWLV